jgi:hypothetical protein
MEYRGIKYEIKMARARNEWAWIVHTLKPKLGNSTGARTAATRAAEKTITNWCDQHPLDCDPATGSAFYRVNLSSEPKGLHYATVFDGALNAVMSYC